MKPPVPHILTLAIVATSLAAAGCSPGGSQSAIDQTVLDRVARAIERQEDRVSAETLADRIISGRDGFVLIDVRPASEFEDGHIDTARRMPLPRLLSPEGRAELPAERSVIIYSGDGSEAAQAAAMLRVAGVDAFTLDGGYAAWLRYTSGPSGTPASTEEALQMAKQQAVACYFQGDYVPAAGLAVKSGSGYTPPLESAQGSAAGGGDALGLGLGLGLGPESAQQPAAQQQPADPLGLGLGIGGGPQGPATGGGTPGTLNIGEGC
jgi:rhodanese-related sulfurtransferase